MKIYLHRNGKNYGPYSLSAIRDFLKSGKCQENELVCCDGKNWIKLRELPGLAESPSITESKEVRAKMPESEARPKPAKRKTLLLGATSFLCVLAVVSAFLFPGEENEEQVHSEDASQGSASPGAGAKGKDFETQDAADRIDAFIHTHLEGENLKPNPEIRDEQFVRRIYLAIIGRIPTVEEATLFLQSGSADKHSSLIDELLANDAGYVAHHYQFWADLLRIPTRIDYTLYYREWIKEQIRENLPYDELVRQLVSGHGLIFENPAAAYYLRDAGMALDNMSNSVRIFLGTRLECAQCHDHPFDKWTQMDYFRMAAYTYDFDVRMGVTKESNRQRIYRDFGKRKWGAYAEAAGFEDFPHLHDESKVEEWLGRSFAPKYLEEKNLTKTQFREAARRGFLARKKAEDFDQPVSQSINMLYGHISNVQVRHHRDKPLTLPHDYQYDNGSPGDVVKPGTMFGPEIPFFEEQTERKNAYAEWLTSPENPRFTRVIVNRLWKRAFGHGLFEPTDNLTDRTEISHPELLAFLEKLMQDLKFDLRAFQKVLFHTKLFRREMHREDHSMGIKFHFAGPLLKRMSAEQIWDSITTLILPNVDTYAPNRKRILDRIARTEAIYQSLEGRPFEEVLPRIREAGAQRRNIQEQQINYEKKISEAYASGDNALARRFTEELKQKVRDMEKQNRDLVFVELRQSDESSPKMMGNSMMSDGMTANTLETNERISKAKPRKAPEGLDQNQRRLWDERERLSLRHFREVVRLMARAVELDSPARRGHFLRDFGQSDREVIENASSHASVPQALYLLNSPLHLAIHNSNSVLGSQLMGLENPNEKIDRIYQAMLCRQPTEKEKQRVLADFKSYGEEIFEDLIWALLNSRQFIFIQ